MRLNHGCVSRRRFLGASAAVLAAPADASLRFGIVTDLHYADKPPSGSRMYGLALGKLDECIASMHAQSAKFLIELGDFKDQGSTPDETITYLRSVERVFQTFRGPRYHVLGNHDVDSISKKQFQEVVSNTGIAGPHTWYSFAAGNWHFVVLDANFTSDGTAYSRGNFDWRDAYVPQAELDWLATDLERARKPTVAFVHQRVDNGGITSVRNAPAVRQVLERSGKVALVLQGHHHPGDYQEINGIHYYTLIGAVEGPRNAYAVVELHSDRRIDITAQGRAVSKRLRGLTGVGELDIWPIENRHQGVTSD